MCVFLLGTKEPLQRVHIYAFSRRFYPKRLTVHSVYTCFSQYMCSLAIEPTTFHAANTMLYHWATGTPRRGVEKRLEKFRSTEPPPDKLQAKSNGGINPVSLKTKHDFKRSLFLIVVWILSYQQLSECLVDCDPLHTFLSVILHYQD